MTIRYEIHIYCESCPHWAFLLVASHPPLKPELRRQAREMDWGYQEGSDFCPECMDKLEKGRE